MNVTTNIHQVNHNDYYICIDEIVEHDADGNPAVVKNICYVIKPNGDSVVFNTSPYQHHSNMLDLAMTWTDCDCPENSDEFGIPQKWDSVNLQEWIVS